MIDKKVKSHEIRKSVQQEVEKNILKKPERVAIKRFDEYTIDLIGCKEEYESESI